MQTVLNSLSAMPGVVGSMVCDAEGRVRGHAFPPLFDDSALQEMATVLSDGAVGLETVTGPIDLIDLRYGEARVFVKPVAGGLVAMLCGKAVNVSLLGISVSVAGKRLEKMLAPVETQAAPPAGAGLAADDVGDVPIEEGVAEAPAAGPETQVDQPADGKKRKKPKTNWFPSV